MTQPAIFRRGLMLAASIVLSMGSGRAAEPVASGKAIPTVAADIRILLPSHQRLRNPITTDTPACGATGNGPFNWPLPQGLSGSTPSLPAGQTATATLTVHVRAASSSTNSTIQGEKVDEQGNLFIGPSTISIRTPSKSWFGPSYDTSVNPFFFTNLAAGVYEAGMQVPDGYSASYSVCTNCVSHPDNSWVQYQVPSPYAQQSTGYAPAIITVPDAGFVDLWWKFTKVDYAQNRAFYQSTLNQKLTCNFEGLGIPPTSNSKSISGANVGVNVGIAGGFGGVATELNLRNLKSSDTTPVNIIEAKSAAGSAWQTSFYGGDRTGNLVMILNQAAGNSDLQWGYTGTYSDLQQLDWNPLYTDHYSDTNWVNNVGTTPCYGNAFRYGDGQSSIQESLLSTSAGNVVHMVNKYTYRSRMAQNWNFWVADQAMYFYRDISKQHNLRVYLVKADGSHVEGPLSVADAAAYIPSTADYAHCSRGSYRKCALRVDNLAYALLVWNIGGSDVGIAIHRSENKAFNSEVDMEFTPICANPDDYSCGNISIHNVVDSKYPAHEVNPIFAAGDTRNYAFAYEVGTLDQLASLGYKTSTATP